MRKSLLTLACLWILVLCTSLSFGACLRVRPVDGVSINPLDRVSIDRRDLDQLKPIGMDKLPKIFGAMRDVSDYETNGCWAGPSGNFDKQILSVGVLQWNYGQNSLQPMIVLFERKFPSRRAFIAWRRKLMPQYGELIFSAKCKRSPISDECKRALLALQPNGILQSPLSQELETLFTNDDMIQIQVDIFVKRLQSVRDDLERIFGRNEEFSPTQVKWAIDTKTQQDGFPFDPDIKRMRAAWEQLPNEERKQALAALVDWYKGLSFSVDQGGIWKDRDCNVPFWRQKINAGLTVEQTQLLNLTFLKSRTAKGMKGFWQANTFERRAKLVLRVGSVAGDRVGIPANAGCVHLAVPAKNAPEGSDESRIVAEWKALPNEERKPALMAIIDWYRGLSFSVDQGRVSRDRECNVQFWRQKIDEGLTVQQTRSLNLAFQETRVHKDAGGFWQALSFARAAARILGVGSVDGRRVGIPDTESCIAPGVAAL
jgi:hypothetical protein